MTGLVAITNVVHEAGIELLEGSTDVVRLWGPEAPADESWRLTVEGLLVRNFAVDEGALNGMPNLKVIVKHGAGVDNIDVESATRRGIAVASTPGVGAVAVAEHAVALMLAVLKQLRTCHDSVVAGDFQVRDSLRTVELAGKTLGLVGCGHIGRVVARICGQGFGMTVLGFDAYADEEGLNRDGITLVPELHDLLRRSDVVSVHAPLTPQTRHMMSAEEFNTMPDDAVLVNTSRGGLVDEESLVHALQSSWIGGAGIDVFEQEPPDRSNSLLGMENVVVSPHMAGLTVDAARRLSRSAAEAILAVFEGREPRNLLNPEYSGRRVED